MEFGTYSSPQAIAIVEACPKIFSYRTKAVFIDFIRQLCWGASLYDPDKRANVVKKLYEEHQVNKTKTFIDDCLRGMTDFERHDNTIRYKPSPELSRAIDAYIDESNIQDTKRLSVARAIAWMYQALISGRADYYDFAIKYVVSIADKED